MKESIPYPECFLGTVVNPGEYWLVSRLQTHVKEVKVLEEMLSDEMNRMLTAPNSESLIPNCCVAVENMFAKGNWHRGKIMEKLEEDKYRIFLVDSGCFTDVQLRQMQLIKSKTYLEVEPLSFKLHIYGVVPFTLTENCKKKVSEAWSESAKEFINNLFSQRVLIYVKKVTIVNRTVFGDLYLIDKPNGQMFSLTNLFCMNDHAVYAESYFKRKFLEIESSSSSVHVLNKDLLSQRATPSLSAKLEIVKQWQLSTAEYQGRYDEEESSVLKSSSDAMYDDEKAKNCDIDSKTNGTKVTVTGKNFLAEEITSKPIKTKSGFKGCDKLSSKSPLMPTLNAVSVESVRETNSGSSFEKKKEFHPILDCNSKESPIVGNGYKMIGNDFRIFTYFRDSAVQPINTFRNLNVPEYIILNLEKEGNFNKLSPIQQWAIPTIRRGHNVVMLGSSKTGKSLAFVISILATLQDQLDAKEMPEGNGPVAIILCSGSRSCENLYYICHSLLRRGSENQNGQSVVRLEDIHGNSREEKSWVKLTNGCELLISTPHCLDRLLKHRSITNLERLEYLILDEAEVITQEPFLSPVKFILHQSKVNEYCQRIFCGEKWTPELDSLVNKFARNHAVLITSYLEAAIYMKLKPDVILVDAEKKSQIVMDATEGKIGKRKIFIVCEYASEVLHLVDVFKAKGYTPLFAHSEMVFHEIKAIKQKWEFIKDAPLIICCDDVIHILGIDDAEMLVHYSLPARSKANFSYRFSTLMKAYHDYSTQLKNEKTHEVLILTDDQNHYQLPHIVDFILRSGGKVPEKILNLSQEISWRKEGDKKDVPICFNLLEFGQCGRLKNCSRRRHAFINEIDSSELYPSGLVKFEVLKVHSVCHLSVRLIQFIDELGNKLEIKNQTDEISDKMREFYSHGENRRFIEEIEVRKLCAVEREAAKGKLFERGQIIQLRESMNRKFSKAMNVLVKMLDTGQISWVSGYKLYELPEELKNYESQAFDIFLCNLLPNDFDQSWSEEAVFSSKTLFTKPLQKNQFWIGRIRLSLRNSLHLEPVKLCRYLENVKTHVIDFCARNKILHQGIAMENENHLEKLRFLCEKANIKMSSYEAVGHKLSEEIVEPQWAFFDGDLIRVDFVSADSASCLFLSLAKFRDLLKNLEKECQKEGEKMKMLNKKWVPDVGMYCLALHEDTWNRGRILSIENDKVLVFFIDYGDCHFTDYVYPMPHRILTQLPAQAIECCLVGVKCDSSDVKPVLDEIYSFSKDGLECLYVSVTGKGSDTKLTGGWKYKVNLLNRDGISLNKRLIDKNLAEAEEGDFSLAENVEIVPSDLEEESNNSAGNEFSDLEEPNFMDDKQPVDLNDPSYKVNFSDDIFDDENAQLMLEEFMAQMFPGCGIEDKESFLQSLEISSEEKTAENTKKLEIEKFDKKCKSSDWYTPQLLWHQDYSKIELKFMLNNVEKYKFECSSTHFIFRCLLAGKLYVASLRMFGAINPQLTEVRLKPFQVQISLKKLCPLMWPRLPMDKQKYRWINFDVENYADEQSSYIEEIYRKAAAEIELRKIKQGKVDGEIKYVPSSDSEHGSEDESDSDSDDDDDSSFI